MKEGCSILEIEDHLFFSDRNHYVVRPALAPVVAWLCDGSERWNEDIRNRVLKASPTIHLMQGDPRKLPLEYKKKLLDALVEHYKRRDRAWIDSDNESLSRFADPALAGHISEIIKAGDVSADVRIEMLQIVRYGRLTACLDTVLDLIAADTASGRLNAYAVAALRDAGETPHLFRLREIIESWPTIPKRLCALLCEALYPKVIDAAGFVELLRKRKLPSNIQIFYLMRFAVILKKPLHPKHAVTSLRISPDFVSNRHISRIFPSPFNFTGLER